MWYCTVLTDTLMFTLNKPCADSEHSTNLFGNINGVDGYTENGKHVMSNSHYKRVSVIHLKMKNCYNKKV